MHTFARRPILRRGRGGSDKSDVSMERTKHAIRRGSIHGVSLFQNTPTDMTDGDNAGGGQVVDVALLRRQEIKRLLWSRRMTLS
jgi:hypothetical protein